MNQNLKPLRHTAEHVLHQAMKQLYASIHLAMGPATDEGFYFDFDPSPKGRPAVQISESDFPHIEKHMQQIIDKDLPLIHQEISPSEAKKLFADNPYKQEWLKEIEGRGEPVSIYWTGEPNQPGSMVDLCSGPHVESTGQVKAFKLLSVAGAYWRGDEKNKMLTRIYGTAWPNEKELKGYLLGLEEAKKRDHRKLGAELDLFSINPLTGQGLILWHPKLAAARNVVEQFWRQEHYRRGYQLVFTPHIASMDMFVKSRHLSKYINYMFPVMLHQYIEGDSATDYTADEVLKPMNCPNHIQIYKSKPRSYRDLPLRIGELGTVYRYERAGVLHGMTRVRGFTQDDSHIFCTPDQVISEVRGVLQLMKYVYGLFGFTDYQSYIATRPEKYLGSLAMWDFAEESLKKAAEQEQLDYKIDAGEGVFYGPKIDMKVKDSIGREWQLGTVQFDFNQPAKAESTEADIDEFWQLKTFQQKFKSRDKVAQYLKRMGRGFDVTYINKEGKQEHCVMIHRVVFGSMERFFGILIEHFGGAFPTWLAPVQVAILPISEKHADYAQQVNQALVEQGIRVELNDQAEPLPKRIREAELQKIPYMLILGDREASSSQVSVRARGETDLGSMPLDQFLSRLNQEIDSKATN